MKRFPKLRPNGWDALIVLAVVVLAGLCCLSFWPHGEEDSSLVAVVSIDGEEQERIPVTGVEGPEDHTFTGSGYTLTAEVRDGGISVCTSDCPTQDCVRTGTIDRAGESIVCLPARISIQLVRADGRADPDGVDTMAE